MSPISAAMRLNCGESWFCSPVLNGEPCVGSEGQKRVNNETRYDARDAPPLTVRIEAHNPVHFCVWSAFHVLLVNVFSGFRVRPESRFSRLEY